MQDELSASCWHAFSAEAGTSNVIQISRSATDVGVTEKSATTRSREEVD
jgi:hypothetical protein